MEIARVLSIDHKTVLNHLPKAGYKKKLDVWIPHKLSVKDMMDRINICDTLLKRNESEPFLKKMITVMKNGSRTIIELVKDRE